MKKFILLFTIVCNYLSVAYSQAGQLDSSFGNNGIVINPSDSTSYKKIVVQKDGKLLLVGTTPNTSFIARYNINGTLDKSFSESGILTADFLVNALALQSDGKIIAVGSTSLMKFNGHFAIARYNVDGSLDNTFGVNGKQATSFSNDYDFASSVAIDKDDKIVAVGTTFSSYPDSYDYDIAVAKYNADGTADNGFSEDGKLITNFFLFEYGTSVALQSNGSIVVGATLETPRGGGGILVGYARDGTLRFKTDVTETGQLSSGGVAAIAIQNDDKIVAIGYKDGLTNLYRYTATGSLDPDFSAETSGGSLAIQSDGKILVGGGGQNEENSAVFALSRCNINGTIDRTFGENGIKIRKLGEGSAFISSLAIHENKVFAAGTFRHDAGKGFVAEYGVIAGYVLGVINQVPPTIILTHPTTNATYLAPANIKLTATASDTDGTISNVEFYSCSHLLHTEYLAPYEYKWTDIPVGNYTLTAKAYDNSGLVTTSAPVHISVVPNKPPIVSIIRPVVKQTIAAPGYIHLEAEAKDVDGRIARVEFYNGSTLIRTEYKYPYTYVWKNVSRGTYTITAVAVDNWAAHTTSAPVTIRVVNPPVTTANKPSFENDETDANNPISLTLTPNPAINILTIHTTGLEPNKEVTISVISESGVVIKTWQFNKQSFQYNVSRLVSGVYTVKVASGDKVWWSRFVKL